MTRFRLRRALGATLFCLAWPSLAQAALDVAGLSKDVDACTDFYQYANRKWLESTPIPDDRSTWGTSTIVSERNEQVLRESLEAAIKNAAPGTPQRKVADYYASGLDLEAIERAGLRPLLRHFTRIDQVQDPRSLALALAEQHRVGSAAAFSFDVGPDPKDSTRYLAEISQAGLGLPDRDYYFKDDERSKQWRATYVRHVGKMFELVGDSPKVASRASTVVMSIETALARASMTATERRDIDKTYNKMSVAELSERAPGLSWTAYLEALGAGSVKELNVSQPAFATAFAKLAIERPVAEWRIYLRWHLLKATASKLPARFRDADFAFYEEMLKGVKTQPSRHRQVVTTIAGPYGEQPAGHALGLLFVDRAFPPEAKARADALIVDIRAALGERIRALDWMGDETKKRALEKLAAITVKIGYPDRWRDFSRLEIGAYPYAENWMRAASFEHDRQLARLGKPVDRTDWWMSPHMVNAYYSSQGNEIVFPAGILQPPFFDAKADDALNYGAIGMVIGHEIIHGFDNRGRRFDAKGNLSDWWTKEDEQRYLARAKLVEEQFDAYTSVEGVKVNGKLTLGENISDLGGLNIAFAALKQALRDKPQGPIEGLTAEQRFFISFAQVWRRLVRPEQERLSLQTDSHSPPRFRVRGPLENMPEFAAAFSCDPTKALRAQSQRVTIW